MARDLRLFYAFRLLATSYLWVPTFVHFMLERGLVFGEIMQLAAIYSLVVIVLEAPTGAFADRMGRRESMMAGTLAMVASCLIFYNAHDFPTFVVAEVFAAVSMTLCSGADSAYLFDLLHENGRGAEYAHYEGRASAWHHAGNGLAFFFGGVLGSFDLALPYLATAGVAAAAFVIALFMRRERREPAAREPEQPSLVDSARQYLRHMRLSAGDVVRGRKLAWVIAYSALVFVLLKATVWVYQPYLKGQGFAIFEIGIVYTGVALVAAVFSHRADSMRRSIGEHRLMWGLLAVLSVSFLALPGVPTHWVISLLVVQAVAMGVYSPLVKVMINREIPSSDRRATVLSVESIVRRAFTGIVLLAAGLYGPHSALYMFGAVGIGGLVVLAVWWQYSPKHGIRSRVPTVVGAEPSSPLDEPGAL